MAAILLAAKSSASKHIQPHRQNTVSSSLAFRLALLSVWQKLHVDEDYKHDKITVGLTPHSCQRKKSHAKLGILFLRCCCFASAAALLAGDRLIRWEKYAVKYLGIYTIFMCAIGMPHVVNTHLGKLAVLT